MLRASMMPQMLLRSALPGGLTSTKVQKNPMPTMMPGIERGNSIRNCSEPPQPERRAVRDGGGQRDQRRSSAPPRRARSRRCCRDRAADVEPLTLAASSCRSTGAMARSSGVSSDTLDSSASARIGAKVVTTK